MILLDISRLVVMVVLLVIWIISTTVALPPTLNSTTFTVNSSRWMSSSMEVVMVMIVAIGVAVTETVFGGGHGYTTPPLAELISCPTRLSSKEQRNIAKRCATTCPTNSSMSRIEKRVEVCIVIWPDGPQGHSRIDF